MPQVWRMFVCFCLLCGLSACVEAYRLDEARELWRNSTPFQQWKTQGFTYRDMVQMLVANMTTEQKIRQIDQYRGREFLENGKLDFNISEKLLSAGVGQIHDLYPPTAQITNELQMLVLSLYQTKGSLPIPIIFAEECLHGLGQGGHTVFPQSLALASSWDTELIFQVAQGIGSESRAYNIRECFSPVLGIAREPRWGRTEETYGEDQYLSGTIGHAYVKGIQQGDQSSTEEFITGAGSLIKHFITYSYPEGGRNTAPAHIGQREFLSEYAPSFYMSLSNVSCVDSSSEFCMSQAIGTMGAYSERDGIPNCSDEWLLTNILREEWGFDGYVLGDLGAVEMLWTTHRVAKSPADSIKQFLQSGGNMQFYDYRHLEYKHAITKLLDDGELSTSILNKRVEEVLYAKAKMGLFDDPFVDNSQVNQYVNSQAHQELALQAARESIILLKNENVLPLTKNQNLKIALIGPNSDIPRLGDYSGFPDSNSTTTCNFITIKEGFYSFKDHYASLQHVWGTGIQTNSDLLTVRPSYLYPLNPQNLQNSTCVGHGLNADYYPTQYLDLFGDNPVLSRVDTQIAFNWYHYSPDAPADNVPEKEFSVRWSGYLATDIPDNIGSIDGWISMNTGGDPVRLYLDGKLIINQWIVSNNTAAVTVPFNFQSHTYTITIEYARIQSTQATLQWSLYGTSGIYWAAEISRESDIAIVCIGEDEHTSGENHDRTSLNLPGHQEALLEAVYATGTPVVAIILSGRPLSIDWASQHIPSILQSFFPGQAGGTAIAEVLFGEFSPSGRLPITIPRNVGQTPMFYNYKPTARPNTYVDEPSTPLYPFGYGLSYSNFLYSNISITSQNISTTGKAVVSFNVTNIGNRDADEVAQLYIRDHVASVTTAVKQLRGYERIANIRINQTRKVDIPIHAATDLWLIDRKYQKIVEPGLFTIFVGPHSNELPLNVTIRVH